MKNDKGEITIIMVITVIILIILGGICIFMLTGENGLFVPKNHKEIVDNGNNTVNTNEQQNATNNNVTNNENALLTTPVE